MGSLPNQPSLSEMSDIINATISELAPRLRELSNDIHDHPELNYEEHHAHDAIVNQLRDLGLPVTPHAFDIPTSFQSEFGSGGRVVVFNAEYDALPGIGHACGHNLIATASMAGYLATVAALKKSGRPGRVRLLGTPAEEGGGGKALLIHNGAYNGVDACVMAHPTNAKDEFGADSEGLAYRPHVGTSMFNITFKGKPAHAAASPWNGVNALDAVVLGYNAVSMFRQHMLPTDRVHGIILESGERSNIIPHECRVAYSIRAATLARMATLKAKIIECFRAGAVASGCEMEVEDLASYAPMIGNKTLCKVFAQFMDARGVHMECDFKTKSICAGATDQGNVAYVVPSIHPTYDIDAGEGNTNHTFGFTAAARSDKAFNRTLLIGEALAEAAWAVLDDDEIFAATKAEFDADVVERRKLISAEEEHRIITTFDNPNILANGEKKALRPAFKCVCKHDE